MYGTTCTSTKEDWRSLLIACGRVAVFMSTVCNPFTPAYHTPSERGGSYTITIWTTFRSTGARTSYKGNYQTKA
jgi:hypothetical protein